MSGIILYDLPSKDRCACWSLNPWKPRLVLNFKGIDYETEWTEYPDIAPKMKSFGIPPKDERYPYTIPVLKLHDKHIMDSAAIVPALEEAYPTPSLHLDDPILPQVFEAVNSLAGPLRGVLLPKVPKVLLNPRSAEYFFRTRKEALGMDLEEYERREGGEKAWEGARQAIAHLGVLLKEKSGAYFLGEEVSYADFVFVGFLEWARRSCGETYERLVKDEPAFALLRQACEPWLARDDR
ncbi:hypothetical protein K402DRAFT_367884 [Aulographum hederae CBS 113979]|uniref:GST N-terminal domain-containing protein n=1 Tax=Aulographum hederae CBS 113979 TaxID=1176131 RepID=A0A6G1HE65_9PEZI|nr:hypothetical protein K402DRAFT_367884 [Aulographum hederae CBS 113979]